MRKIRRRCKNPDCREWFHPGFQHQTWCSAECGTVMALAKREKDRHRAIQDAEQRRKNEAQQERRELKIRKVALKTKPQWKKEAQAAFNKYVRLRDAGLPCISCGSTPEQKFGGTMDCGHYRSRGAAAHLSFNLHNTAGQCARCNRHDSGAQKAFEQGLIERIGAEKVEALNNDNSTRKFDIPYLQRIKSIFTRKTRALEKRRARKQEIAA